jgi:hypothetical protein
VEVGNGRDVEDEDGDGSGFGGSGGGEEDATKCRTASQKTTTIFSIGSDRKASISGSVRGWFVLTF